MELNLERIDKLLRETEVDIERWQMEKRIYIEKKAWKEVLGVEFDILPLPEYITPEIIKKLEKFGFELRYIPKLDFDPDYLKDHTSEEYVEMLHKKYPKWNPIESLSIAEEDDYTISRNLQLSFWNNIKKGASFPVFPGQWAAVEIVEKPVIGNEYKQTPILQLLQLESRFNNSWEDVILSIHKNKKHILSEIGLLDKAYIGLLYALEWNLLGNREGWGKTNTAEMVLDMSSDNLKKYSVGDASVGGAGKIDTIEIDKSYSDVGFRLIISLL